MKQIPEHLQPIYDMKLDELAEKVKQLICDLASQKKKWRMSVPPRWDDTDMLLYETIVRLHGRVKELEAGE